jgi:hypothetical protein
MAKPLHIPASSTETRTEQPAPEIFFRNIFALTFPGKEALSCFAKILLIVGFRCHMGRIPRGIYLVHGSCKRQRFTILEEGEELTLARSTHCVKRVGAAHIGDLNIDLFHVLCEYEG